VLEKIVEFIRPWSEETVIGIESLIAMPGVEAENSEARVRLKKVLTPINETVEASDGFVICSLTISTITASNAITVAIASMTKLNRAVRNLPPELSAIVPQSRSSSHIVTKNSMAACALMYRPEHHCLDSIIGCNSLVEF
jgi:hypothetical protein